MARQKENIIKKGQFLLESVSRYRSEIYGLSIIWIFLFHMKQIEGWEVFKDVPKLQWINEIHGMGNMGVDVFLFMSGICLYFSFVKNEDIMEFIKKRMTKIFLPLFLITGPLWIVYLVMHEITLPGLFCRMSLISYWVSGDIQVWFSSLILVLYLIYPYVYYYMFKNTEWKTAAFRASMLILLVVLLTVCIQHDVPEYFEMFFHALPRIPVFLCGCFLGKWVYEKKSIPLILPVTATVAFFVLKNYLQQTERYKGLTQRYTYWLGGMVFVFLFAVVLPFLPKVIHKILSFLGGISYELYLSHVTLIRVLKLEPFSSARENKATEAVLLAVLSILLSVVVSSILKWILNRKKAGCNFKQKVL